MSENLLEESAKYPPTIRDRYKDGYGNVQTDKRVQFFLRSLSQGKNDQIWKEVRENELKMSTYKYDGETKEILSKDQDALGNEITFVTKTIKSDRTYITRGNSLREEEGEGEIADKKTWVEDMSHKLNRLSDYHADLFMDILAQSMFLEEGCETFWYDLSGFLDRRGLKRKPEKDADDKAIHCHERKNLRIAYRALLDVANIWVVKEERTDTITEDVRLKRKPIVKKDGMKLVALLQYYANNEYVSCENMEEEELEVKNPTPYRWKVRLGDWLRDGSEIFAYSQFSQIILRYHPCRQWLEKRLARYCLFYRRMNEFQAVEGKGFEKGITVHKLLDSVGMIVDEYHPKESKDRFEKALDQLKTDNLIRGWKYKSKEPLTTKYWLKDWCQDQIVFAFTPKKEKVQS